MKIYKRYFPSPLLILYPPPSVRPLGVMTWCSVQFSCSGMSDLWDPIDCSTPGLLVHHQLPEFTQTHVHWGDDAIQPSHSLLSPSPPAFKLSIRVFSNESVLCIWWPEYWSFSFSISPSSEYSGLISFRMHWLDLLTVQRDSQESSPTPHFKRISSSVLSFLYGPPLTSIHDYWKNHSLD